MAYSNIQISNISNNTLQQEDSSSNNNFIANNLKGENNRDVFYTHQPSLNYNKDINENNRYEKIKESKQNLIYQISKEKINFNNNPIIKITENISQINDELKDKNESKLNNQSYSPKLDKNKNYAENFSKNNIAKRHSLDNLQKSPQTTINDNQKPREVNIRLEDFLPSDQSLKATERNASLHEISKNHKRKDIGDNKIQIKVTDMKSDSLHHDRKYSPIENIINENDSNRILNISKTHSEKQGVEYAPDHLDLLNIAHNKIISPKTYLLLKKGKDSPLMRKFSKVFNNNASKIILKNQKSNRDNSKEYTKKVKFK